MTMKFKSAIILLALLAISGRVRAQVILTPTDDCYIYAAGAKAGEAYGTLDPDSLKVRKSVASEEFTRETYLMFDLGEIDTTYLSARVKLYGQVAEGKRTLIYFTDTTWNEATLTGNTRPAGTFISDLLLSPGTDYYSWDVTSCMNQMAGKGVRRVAFILKDIAGAVSTRDSRWYSKENPANKPPLLELQPGPLPFHRNGAYYIDATNGNDAASGESPQLAWKTLDRINREPFIPGDSILFRSGDAWLGQLAFRGSGIPGKQIVIGAYGNGPKPVINGAGTVENTVQFFDQQYFTLQDIHITNTGTAAEFRRALYIRAEDMGSVRSIALRRLEISDVNGSMTGEVSKNNGGIFLEISGSSKPTWFDTLTIEDCYIHDVDRTGISNRSSWDERSLTNNVNWVPSRNIVIRNNTIANIGANGMIVRVARKPLMEYNLFTRCGLKGSGNACFSFNTDSAVWQYNEACFTKYNANDDDAGGFDSDYNSKYTIIQYNYSHGNEYGALLVTGGPGGNFNDGTVVRYNVLADNGDHVIRTSGQATNTLIYNNTVYSRSALGGISVVWHKSWEGYSKNTKYYNNIFQVLGSGANVTLGQSTGNLFDYNLWSGPGVSGMPADANIILADPLFVAPSVPQGLDSLSGFRLLKDSPAINSGMVVAGAPTRDFEGNQVPFHLVPDRGAFEYTGPFASEEHPALKGWSVHPNPCSQQLVIGAPASFGGPLTVRIFTFDGKMVFSKDYSSIQPYEGLKLDRGFLKIPDGFYLVVVQNSSGNVFETKVLFQ